MEVDINTLRRKLPKLEDLYGISCKLYYLPEIKSRAISVEWLVSLHTVGSKVWCPPASTIRYNYKFMGRGAKELLKELNAEVKRSVHASKETGFTEKNLPNMNWLKDSLLMLWKGVDKLGFLLDEPVNYQYSEAERNILHSAGKMTLTTT